MQEKYENSAIPTPTTLIDDRLIPILIHSATVVCDYGGTQRVSNLRLAPVIRVPVVLNPTPITPSTCGNMRIPFSRIRVAFHVDFLEGISPTESASAGETARASVLLDDGIRSVLECPRQRRLLPIGYSSIIVGLSTNSRTASKAPSHCKKIPFFKRLTVTSLIYMKDDDKPLEEYLWLIH